MNEMNNTLYTQLKYGYITIPPFANTLVGDTLLFLERDDEIIIFNKRLLENNYDHIVDEKIMNVHLKESRDFLRNLGSGINYSSIVEENYQVKIHKDLIDKYNLNEQVLLKEEGNHLICKNKVQNKKTR